MQGVLRFDFLRVERILFDGACKTGKKSARDLARAGEQEKLRFAFVHFPKGQKCRNGVSFRAFYAYMRPRAHSVFVKNEKC